MDYEAALSTVKEAWNNKIKYDNNRAWEAYNYQHDIMKTVGVDAYFILFKGVFGSPGPVGMLPPETFDEAAKALMKQPILDAG